MTTDVLPFAPATGLLPQRRNQLLVAAAIFAAISLTPFLVRDVYLQNVLVLTLLYAAVSQSWNILGGYCGQISLGTGGFMAVGAYSAFKLTTAFPWLNMILVFVLAGLVAAGVGLLFGIPSLRIKGFYLAVATLAAQFFLIWLFNKVGWFVNYASSGTATAPPRTMLGVMVTGPEATAPVRYLMALGMVVLFALVAKNLVRGRVGRSWMAMRDRDIAAEIIGIKPLQTKLLAFAISSFYCGVAGAELLFLYLGSVETLAFDINLSFLVLFMVIIGGLGSVLGSFLGAAFIVLVPIFLTNAPHWLGLAMRTDTQKHLELMIFGGLIVFFLIVEPRGLARLWQITKEKLRLWPFPH
ncbi:MAG: branched-chain amino acid ABC transporter permease [Sphingomonadaceae bacterium]